MRCRFTIVGESVGKEEVVIDGEDGKNLLYSYIVLFFRSRHDEWLQ